MGHGSDEEVTRIIDSFQRSERQYDEFLSARGLDRSDIRRAALGVRGDAPARRRIIDRVMAWFEGEQEQVPGPAGAVARQAPGPRVPPHAIRI